MLKKLFQKPKKVEKGELPSETPILSTFNESPQTIAFPNGHSAQLITVPLDIDPKQAIDKLSLKLPSALMMMSGDTKDLDKDVQQRLVQLFSRGIARVAIDMNVMLMDNGKTSDLVNIIGQSVADRGYKSALVGVSSAKQVTYPSQSTPLASEGSTPLEPNHSLFILVDTQDSNREIEFKYRFGTAVATDKPAVTILVNGGEQARTEILQSVRLGWPIIVLSGTGQLADEITDLYQKTPDFIADPVLAEIMAEGHISLFPVEGKIEELERLIHRQLRGDNTLKLAWEQFAIFDQNATLQQKLFHRLQFSIISIGVLGTLLALFQVSLDLQIKLAEAGASGLVADVLTNWKGLANQTVDFLRYMIVSIPVIVTVLVAISNRFNAGQKWIGLRSSAEMLKSEIFRYRSQAGIYHAEQCVETSRETKLAEKIQGINNHLMQTEVNMSALKPYQGSLPPRYSTAGSDDGWSVLSPERYLNTRLEDQLNYYRNKTTQLERQWSRLQWLIYILGGLGTLLAARGLELWIALTTGLVAAIGSYLGYKQLEERLAKYNQAAMSLTNVRNWWAALPPHEQAQKENVDLLISETEEALGNEFNEWTQKMQDAIIALKEKQAKATAKSKSKIIVKQEQSSLQSKDEL